MSWSTPRCCDGPGEVNAVNGNRDLPLRVHFLILLNAANV